MTTNRVTFYNANGDKTDVENTPENIKAMEKAGFTRDLVSGTRYGLKKDDNKDDDTDTGS